jgi:hypothetical protein
MNILLISIPLSIILASIYVLIEETNSYCGGSSFKPIIIIMLVFYVIQLIVNALFIILPDVKKFNKIFSILFFLAPPILAIYILIHYAVVDGCKGEEGMKLLLRASIIIITALPIEYVIDIKMRI